VNGAWILRQLTGQPVHVDITGHFSPECERSNPCLSSGSKDDAAVGLVFSLSARCCLGAGVGPHAPEGCVPLRRAG